MRRAGIGNDEKACFGSTAFQFCEGVHPSAIGNVDADDDDVWLHLQANRNGIFPGIRRPGDPDLGAESFQGDDSQIPGQTGLIYQEESALDLAEVAQARSRGNLAGRS